jgi:hypothetical protein
MLVLIAGTIGHMASKQKITIARNAQQELLKLEGKVQFSKTWEELKDDR